MDGTRLEKEKVNVLLEDYNSSKDRTGSNNDQCKHQDIAPLGGFPTRAPGASSTIKSNPPFRRYLRAREGSSHPIGRFERVKVFIQEERSFIPCNVASPVVLLPSPSVYRFHGKTEGYFYGSRESKEQV